MNIDFNVWVAVASFLVGLGANALYMGRWAGRIETVLTNLTAQQSNDRVDIKAIETDVRGIGGKVEWLEGRVETHGKRLDHLEARCDQRHNQKSG